VVLAFISLLIRHETCYAKYVNLLDKLKEVKNFLFLFDCVMKENSDGLVGYTRHILVIGNALNLF
jgi:hypothetical protein